MAGTITESTLKAKIASTEAQIRRHVLKRKELENELKVYKRLLQEIASDPADAKQLTASEAILAYLGQAESANTAELVEVLEGKFQTSSGDPRSAIYAAIAALKDKGQIEPVSGDSRRYRIVENEAEEADIQRAAI